MLPIYNCLISDTDDDQTGIFAISFVDAPAVEVDFVALRRQAQQPVRLSRDSRKQILTGVVLRPQQLIYRHTPELGEHYIQFSAAEIERIAHKMMRTGIALHNTTHQHQSPLAGNYLTELWIVEDPTNDKSRALGFENLPKGTLMCSYKVEDPDYWTNEVMTGHVKGFSLEGFFNQQIINKTEQKCKKMNKKKRTTLLGKIANLLLDIEAVKRADATQSGQPYVLFTLADGQEIYVDEDGFATLDNEQAPAGEHKLANGSLLVVDAQGQFVETKQGSDAAHKPAAAPAADTPTGTSIAPEVLHNRKQRLAAFDPKTSEALKAKIAEMQATIDDLATALTAAQSLLEGTQDQVEELRRRTPSVRPVHQVAAATPQRLGELTAAQRLALALNQRKKE